MADIQPTDRIDALFERIASLIDQARTYVANAVKIAEVKTRYEVGRYILEDEQQGERAQYGKQTLRQLSSRLMERYGDDWTYDTLVRCRKFYQSYANASIVATTLPQLESSTKSADSKSVANSSNAVATIQLPRFILSWSHYLILMRIDNIEARSFYELEYAQQQCSGNYIQTILYRNNNDEEWQIVGVTEGHENPTTFVVSAEEEYKRYIILAQRYTSSNWFYMTADLGPTSTKRYQAVDAGTNILTNVTTIDLDEKYYWEIEGYKLKNGNQYSTWSSGNSAKFDAIGKDLTIQQQADGTYTFSFADGSDTRYLSLNKTAGNDYFAYYKGTSQVYKLTLVKEGTTTPTAIENTSDESHHDSPIRKVIEDGQLYIILPNGTRYTATGAKVEEEMGR